MRIAKATMFLAAVVFLLAGSAFADDRIVIGEMYTNVS